MQVNAHMDVDVIAVEQEDRVTLMLELLAPAAKQNEQRPASTVQVVLDRSGSMAGERLDAAKGALIALIDRLDPEDRLGVVAFDDSVTVVIPAGELRDKHAARTAIASLSDGGSTDLSAGLLRGCQEARRAAGEAGATLLLLSDGHANQGETDPVRLAGVAAGARRHGITVSTVGIGLGYDELLLAEVARGGQGNHVFAEHGDGAAAAVAGEVEGLLSKTVQAASLLIRPERPVESVKVWNDLPCSGVTGGVMVELGDLWAGERRRLLIGDRTGLAISDLARRLTAIFDLDEGARAADYLQRIERDELDERRLSRRLTDALAAILRVDPDQLAIRPQPSAAQAFFRAENDSNQWLAEEIDALSRAALTPAPEPLDELDRLFLGGPGG